MIKRFKQPIKKIYWLIGIIVTLSSFLKMINGDLPLIGPSSQLASNPPGQAQGAPPPPFVVAPTPTPPSKLNPPDSAPSVLPKSETTPLPGVESGTKPPLEDKTVSLPLPSIPPEQPKQSSKPLEPQPVVPSSEGKRAGLTHGARLEEPPPQPKKSGAPSMISKILVQTPPPPKKIDQKKPFYRQEEQTPAASQVTYSNMTVSSVKGRPEPPTSSQRQKNYNTLAEEMVGTVFDRNGN